MRYSFFLSLALAGAMIPALLAQAPSEPIEQIIRERQALQDKQHPQPPVQPPQPAPATAPALPKATLPQQQPRMADQGLLTMDNVSLLEMVNLIAKMLKINILVDPRVKGSVTIHTYGETKTVDLMSLLETILRVNGSTIVKVGDLYRIVPVNAVSNLPLTPIINGDTKTLPDDEQMVLNLIFLKYATAADMDKLLAYLRKIRFRMVSSSSGSVLGSALMTGDSGSWDTALTGTIRYRSPTLTMVQPLTRRMTWSSGINSTGFTSP